MTWRKGLSFDPTTRRKVWIDIVQATMVSVAAAANNVPQANAQGKIDATWVPPLPIAVLPVAANGEVSSTELVRADDARLGNPPVGGDLDGTAGSAVVVGLRGRTVAGVAPAHGDGIVWNQAADQWEPGTVGGDAGNAVQLQGRDVSSAAPALHDALTWSGSAWAPAAGGGGDTEEYVAVGIALVLTQQRPFG